MLKKHFAIIFIILSINLALSQVSNTVTLSSFSKISIITSGPGDALFEKFGHSAIRVKDPTLQLDLLYNYGIFDFENPNFYVDFTKGYMQYKLARYPFYLSLKSNQKAKRWVKEQILNLTDIQKNSFFQFLEKNAAPENASYLYDPYFNNCATKPRDILKNILGESLVFKDDFVFEGLSLRALMNKQIHTNTWGNLGINIALGNRLDKVASPFEYLYLPDYLYEALKSAKVKRAGKLENLVISTTTLLNFEEKTSTSDVISPFLVILLISLIGLFITYKDYKNNKRSKWLDFSLFFATGILGVLIIYLWFFTNHSTAPNNFNFLWAWAPNIIIGFLLLKRNTPHWITKYCTFLLIFILIIPFIWLAKIQVFSFTLIPLLVLLGVRYWFLQKTLNS